MGESFLDKNGAGGDKINGIISDYYVYAGENISAGSFVEFINGIGSTSTKASNVYTFYNNTASHICACKLTEEKVLVICQGSSIGYARLLSVSNGTISLLKSGSPFADGAISYTNMVALDENKVLISYVLGGITTTLGILDTSLLGQSGAMTIYTAGAGSSSYPETYTDVAMLTTTTGIVVWNRERSSSSTTYGLRARAFTISGTTISFGTATSIEAYPHYCSSLCVLDNSRVMLSYQDANGSKYGNSYILTVSGTTITKGTEYTFDTTGASSIGTEGISQDLIDKNKVLMAYDKGNNGGMAQIAIISGTTITFGTSSQYLTGGSASNNVHYLGDNKFVVVFEYAVYNRPWCVVGTIASDNTITFGSTYNFNSNTTTVSWVSSVLLNKAGHLLVSYCNEENSNYGEAILIQVSGTTVSNNMIIPQHEMQVRKTLSSNANGVAKTSGIGGTSTAHGETLSVYVNPTYYDQFNMIASDDFDNSNNTWEIHSSLGGSSGFELISNNYPTQNSNTKSLRLYRANETKALGGASTQTQFTVRTGHIYYIACYYKFTNVTNVNYGEFIVANYVRTTLSKTATSWTRASNRFSMTASDYSLRATIRTIQTDSTLRNDYPELFVNGIRCYDLTAIFGAGNEPTKEWCDENL